MDDQLRPYILILMFKKYLSIKYYVYIYDDLSVKCRYGHVIDNSNNFLITDKLSGIDNFLDIQINIEKTPICIGVISQKRSPDCKHIIPQDKQRTQ